MWLCITANVGRISRPQLGLVEDVGVDSEWTEEIVETEDDDSETSIVGDPIVVVEIPGAIEPIDFPWLVVSDDD